MRREAMGLPMERENIELGRSEGANQESKRLKFN